MGRPHKITWGQISLYLFIGFILYTTSIGAMLYTNTDLYAPFSEQWWKYLIGIVVVSLVNFCLKVDFDTYLD